MRATTLLLTGLLVYYGGTLLETGEGTLVYETIWSRSLEANLIGDGAARNVLIYLPPGYATETARRYPVIYFLHGYNATNTVWRDGLFGDFKLPGSVDRLIAGGKIEEMILVMPDGRNAYGGSFYVNSPVTGNWEDFVAWELVAHVDSTYRSIPHSASRGIAGHSMGGYGAIRLAMRNPDVFSVVYGVSACCLAMVGDVGTDNPAWRKTLTVRRREELAGLDAYPRGLIGLGAALSPNLDRPPFFADLPFQLENGEVRPNQETYEKWSAGFPTGMLAEFADKVKQLRGIRFSVGRDDEFSNILLGSRVFSEALSEKGISHDFKEYDGDHWNQIDAQLMTDVLPFFSEKLTPGRD